MLSAEGHAVAITANFNCAVALATFGYPYRLERLRDEVTGDMASCLWHLDPSPLFYSKSRDDEPMPQVSSATILRALKAGTLERDDPAHPVIDVLHALNIYECIRTYMERGTAYRIASTLDPIRFTLVEGSEPAADVKRPAVRTDSLELATALVRMGHPLLSVEGTQPHRRLVIASASYRVQPSLTAAVLAECINSGYLQRSEPEHPALWCIVGLRNRRAMKAQMQRDAIPMLLRNPRSLSWERRMKSVIIPGTATGKDIDRARTNL